MEPESVGSRVAGKKLTRSRIMEVGLRLFARNGYATTTVSELAREAGIAVGTVYFHFGDKEGLLRTILDGTIVELFRRLEALYDSPPADPRTLGEQYYRVLFDYLEDDLVGRAFIIRTLMSQTQPGRDAYEEVVGLSEKNIRLGIARGIYRSDIDPALLARAETGRTLALLVWWVEDTGRAERQDLIRTLIEVRHHGILKAHNQ